MMTWNYRVTKKRYGAFDSYSIREVFYDKDGAVTSWTERSVGVHGDTLKDLQGDMLNYIRSIGEPVLDLDELESVLDCKREEESK